MYNYKAKVIKVSDGDTFKLEVDLGFGCSYTDKFRILELDTYETKLYKKYHVTPEHKKKGLMIKDFATELLQDKDVTIETLLIKGYYKRYLCKLFFQYDDQTIDLRNMMVDFGCDKKYDGYPYNFLVEDTLYPHSLINKYKEIKSKHGILE